MIDIADQRFAVLTCSARVVLAVIDRMTTREERVTLDEIADRAGLDRGTVTKCIRSAESRGFLVIDRRHLPFGFAFTPKAGRVFPPADAKTR